MAVISTSEFSDLVFIILVIRVSKYLNGSLISTSVLYVGDHYIGLSGCLNITESFVFVSQVYLIYK